MIRQLEWHLLVLEHGLPSLKYGLQSANKVLLVFETDVALDAVLKRLLTRLGFEEFAPLVACSMLERLKKNFEDWWYVRGGEIRGGGLV